LIPLEIHPDMYESLTIYHIYLRGVSLAMKRAYYSARIVVQHLKAFMAVCEGWIVGRESTYENG